MSSYPRRRPRSHSNRSESAAPDNFQGGCHHSPQLPRLYRAAIIFEQLEHHMLGVHMIAALRTLPCGKQLRHAIVIDDLDSECLSSPFAQGVVKDLAAGEDFAQRRQLRILSVEKNQ